MASTASALSDRIRRLLCQQDGGVTVDWVVLSAGIIGLTMAVIYPIMHESVQWGEGLVELIEKNTYNR